MGNLFSLNKCPFTKKYLNFECKLIRYKQKNKSDQRDKNRDKWLAVHELKKRSKIKT